MQTFGCIARPASINHSVRQAVSSVRVSSLCTAHPRVPRHEYTAPRHECTVYHAYHHRRTLVYHNTRVRHGVHEVCTAHTDGAPSCTQTRVHGAPSCTQTAHTDDMVLQTMRQSDGRSELPYAQRAASEYPTGFDLPHISAISDHSTYLLWSYIHGYIHVSGHILCHIFSLLMVIYPIIVYGHAIFSPALKVWVSYIESGSISRLLVCS